MGKVVRRYNFFIEVPEDVIAWELALGGISDEDGD